MAKSSTPIPQDKIGESFVWRDWFQRLSDRVFGTLASQDASSVAITGGAVDDISITNSTINSTTIGATTPSTGKFTDLYAATLAVDTGTDGQVLIGRTSDHHFVPALLTAGTNVSIATGPSSVTISASTTAGPIGLTGLPGIDGIDGEDGQVIPGPRGLTGSQGPQGAATYLEADYQEAEMFLVPGNQGTAGATGATGATGSQGLTGVPVYLEAEQGEDGPMGPPGLTGLTGSQGPMGVAVFLEADAGEQGDMGPPGLMGITGAQGPIGPAVYLEAPEADEPMPFPGPTGVQGIQGLPGVAVYLEAPEAEEPMFTGGPTVPVNGSLTWSVPVTKTADFTLGVFETYVINNKAAATCTVTLPSASGYPGRPVSFINYKAFTLVSASSNVVPIAGGSAGTAILAASVGDTTTLISDGTNWIQVNYEPNNCLLLE